MQELFPTLKLVSDNYFHNKSDGNNSTKTKYDKLDSQVVVFCSSWNGEFNFELQLHNWGMI